MKKYYISYNKSTREIYGAGRNSKAALKDAKWLAEQDDADILNDVRTVECSKEIYHIGRECSHVDFVIVKDKAVINKLGINKPEECSEDINGRINKTKDIIKTHTIEVNNLIINILQNQLVIMESIKNERKSLK